MVLLLWLFLAPLLVIITFPLATIFSIKNLFFAGPFVPIKQCFTPLLKLVFLPSVDRKVAVQTISESDNIVTVLATISACFHFFAFLHCCGITYISFIPYPHGWIPALACLFATVTILPVVFHFDSNHQKIYYVPKDCSEYRQALSEYVEPTIPQAADNSEFHQSIAEYVNKTSPGAALDLTWSSHNSYRFTDQKYGDIYLKIEQRKNCPDNLIDSVSVRFSNAAACTAALSLLLYTFDNTSNPAKVQKIDSYLSNQLSLRTLPCEVKQLRYRIRLKCEDNLQYLISVSQTDK